MPPTSDLVGLSAVELRQRIGRKQISPTELLEACIERIGAINPAVNAIAATDYRRARADAKLAEAHILRGEPLGLLFGLPIGVKDLTDTAGLLTTHGSPLYRQHVPKTDAAMVTLLRQAGALIVAKTNTPEFGAGANTRNPVWGATGNPFNPMLNAGGSSGGSAVALACDMLPLCTGSDMGGSLRIPAAHCGVVGMRPSPGVVPDETRPLGWTPISVLGPMARSVADLRLLLAAQLGMSEAEPLAFPLPREAVLRARDIDLARLRVAWTADFGQCPVSTEIRKLMRARIEAIRHLFRSCEEVRFDFGEADRCFDIVRVQSFVAKHQAAYEKDPACLGPNVRANYELGANMTLGDAAWAHAEQTRIFHRFQRHFRDHDLVLSPATAVSPFPWREPYLAVLEGKPLNTYYHWLALTYYISLVSNPAIALPCGVDDHGMPFGVQLIGAFRGDLELLNAAEALEQAFAGIAELRRPRPDAAGLSGWTNTQLQSIVTHPPVAQDRD
jgi:Asp-tRNA(Asn)/Glu-tRNA(Gln) amidotransferase A subunit family amidase